VAKFKGFGIGSFFQGLGKTFMLPVALLAAMGLLLGIGSSFSAGSTIAKFPFLGWAPLKLFFEFITAFSLVAFSNLAALFAIAIPIGLAKQEKGVAAFAGFVGFITLNLGINYMLSATGSLYTDPSQMRDAGQAFILGIHTVDTGVLGGIVIGIIVAKLHNRFYAVQFPDAFSFFGGARFVPIITAVVAACIGVVVPVVWPFFSALIKGVGYLISKSGIFAPWIFFTGERVFLPFGLHHILVALVRFTEIGGSAVVNGDTVYGALNIFYKEFAAGVPISHEATRFLSQGKMPSFLFGLPAAALAMYNVALKDRKPLVKGLFLSGVVSCMVGGITEPIEFLFLFIAPGLYVFHALMTGLGAMIVELLGVSIGNTDGNVLDFLIFGILQGTSTKWYMLFVVGPVWFALYYFVFKWAILKWDFKTPGREISSSQDPENTQGTQGESPSKSAPAKTLKNYTALKFIEALGGKDNFVSVDNCVTRLRLILKDTSIVDEKALKENGALGIIKPNNTDIQVVIGPQVHILKQQIDKELS
jgi:PTS system maltose and glucose-specific IIC component